MSEKTTPVKARDLWALFVVSVFALVAGMLGPLAPARADGMGVGQPGTVVAWGLNHDGQASVPAGLTGVTAIAAGARHSLALKGDGTVVAWGLNNDGQASVPAGLTGVTAIAAGAYHSLALKGDGTVVAWGVNDDGQASVPAGLTGVTAIAAGGAHNLALKGDGTAVAWGANIYGQASVPAGLTGVTAIAGGGAYSLALTGSDTDPPTLHLPDALNAEASGPAGATVTYKITVTDTVDADPSVTCTHDSGATFPVGHTTVQCTATDASGNTATGSFTVTVADTTSPTLTVPSDVTAEAVGPAGANVPYSAVTAADTVDPDPSVACSPDSGAIFPLGHTTVHCTATDASGNTASGSFTVTVADTTAPLVTAPADVTVTATSATHTAVTYQAATAYDAVEGTVPATCTPASGSGFPLGATHVVCTATDAAGNTGTASFDAAVSYAWSGVLQPVNADGSSIFKAGSTVPIRFALSGASAGITDATARLTFAKVDNGIEGSVVEAVTNVTATSGNLFRYSDGQYIYNWSTKGMIRGTYAMKIDLGDGVSHSVHVSLK